MINHVKLQAKTYEFSPPQYVVSSAKDWEKQLETLARAWRTLQQRQQQLEDWLHTAQNILDDSDDDPDSLIRKHKVGTTHSVCMGGVEMDTFHCGAREFDLKILTFNSPPLFGKMEECAVHSLVFFTLHCVRGSQYPHAVYHFLEN